MKLFHRLPALISGLLAAFFAGVSIISAAEAADVVVPLSVVATPQRTMPRKAQLPFLFQDLTEGAEKSYGQRPVEVESTRAEFRLSIANGTERVDENFRIELMAVYEQIVVKFSYREGSQIHYVGQFFEMPLFTAWESDHLYRLLYQKANGRVWSEFPRFRACIDTEEVAGWSYVILRLAPTEKTQASRKP